MSENIYWSNDKKTITGSVKVQGHEQWVAAFNMANVSVENKFDSSRAAQRHAGEPTVQSLVVQNPLGKDVVMAFDTMAGGKPCGKTTVSVVQSDQNLAVAEHTYSLADSYVSGVYISYKYAQALTDGVGVVTTIEFTGDELSIEYDEVGQDQNKKGKVAVNLSMLKQASSN
jgi:type VI protein secretion system component Hcp